jgi:hypothetical protein
MFHNYSSELRVKMQSCFSKEDGKYLDLLFDKKTFFRNN